MHSIEDGVSEKTMLIRFLLILMKVVDGENGAEVDWLHILSRT